MLLIWVLLSGGLDCIQKIVLAFGGNHILPPGYIVPLKDRDGEPWLYQYIG